MLKRLGIAIGLAASLVLPQIGHAQSAGCEEHVGDPAPVVKPAGTAADPKADLLEFRALKYAALATEHRLTGLASYYSKSLDGTLTATGEIFRNKRFTAAHLTLPLGTWIEVTARATGKKIRCRINDRGPYVKKFVLDLSEAAARALGVDRAADRYVDIHVIALPGEDPLPANWQLGIGATPIATGDAAPVAQ